MYCLFIFRVAYCLLFISLHSVVLSSQIWGNSFFKETQPGFVIFNNHCTNQGSLKAWEFSLSLPHSATSWVDPMRCWRSPVTASIFGKYDHTIGCVSNLSDKVHFPRNTGPQNRSCQATGKGVCKRFSVTRFHLHTTGRCSTLSQGMLCCWCLCCSDRRVDSGGRVFIKNKTAKHAKVSVNEAPCSPYYIRIAKKFR